MALTPGTCIGPYEVVSALGVGGMGEVYLARDTKLERDVALKSLPDSFAADPDRLARFTREAHTLASLNHPNIAHIHRLEESSGVRALVMELVEGEDLTQRIARGAITLDEALPIARQIAEALEAAHEHGIIHRDLKPANIKLRPDGTVKVLDFGLAKAMDLVGSAPGLSQSPTITTAAMTQSGIILGTSAYMSPEQAKGQQIDRTTDVWAFGCVCFEMLAGQAAFSGSSVSEVVSEVLKSEPDWSQLPASTPDALRRLLRRCLRKDRRARLQHIGDARVEIQEIISETDTRAATTPPTASRQAGRTVLPWALAALLLATTIGALLFAVSVLPGRTGPSPVTRLDLLLPAGVEMHRIGAPTAAISPDGSRIVFVGTEAGTRRLYVRRLDQDDAMVLKGTDTGSQPFWATDGRSVGFVKGDRTLQRVSLSDGLVSTILTGVDRNLGAAWGPDDRVTFVREDSLWQVPSGGGEPTRLTTLNADRRERTHTWPTVINDGKSVLLTVLSDDARPRIDVVTVATGERHTVIDPGMNAAHSSTGHIVYFDDGSLLAAPFDASRLVASGRSVRVLEDVARDNVGAPLFALSASGALVYASNRNVNSRLVWVNRQGIATSITPNERPYESPRLSPDGRRVVVSLAGDLFALDMARATFARLLTGDMLGGSYGVWMRGSSRLAFRTATGLRIMDADGNGGVQVIPDTSAADFPVSTSKDGDTVAFIRQTADRSSDVYVVSLENDHKPRAVVSTPAFESAPYFSPDGRWMAYVSDESGHFEVYVRPYPGPDRKVLVSSEGGVQPVWRGDGKELFYRSGTKMFVVDVATTPNLTLSTPRVLFDARYALRAPTIPNYDVTTDGQRFVMIEDNAGSGRLSVVLNWSVELNAFVPPE